MKLQIPRLFLLSLLISTSMQSYAEDESHIELRGVVGWSNLGMEESHISFYPAGVSDPARRDTLKEADENAFQGGAGIFYVLPLLCNACNDDTLTWFPEIKAGVMAYGFGHKISGEQLLYGESHLDRVHYEMDIDNFRLMFDVDLTLVSWEDLSLFILGGVGESWSWVKYDLMSTVIGDASGTIDTHLSTTVAWEVGAGLAYDITENLSVSLQYLFTDFGTLKTGDDLTTSQGLHFEADAAEFDLHSNTAFLGLAWEL